MMLGDSCKIPTHGPLQTVWLLKIPTFGDFLRSQAWKSAKIQFRKPKKSVLRVSNLSKKSVQQAPKFAADPLYKPLFGAPGVWLPPIWAWWGDVSFSVNPGRYQSFRCPGGPVHRFGVTFSVVENQCVEKTVLGKQEVPYFVYYAHIWRRTSSIFISCHLWYNGGDLGPTFRNTCGNLHKPFFRRFNIELFFKNLLKRF